LDVYLSHIRDLIVSLSICLAEAGCFQRPTCTSTIPIHLCPASSPRIFPYFQSQTFGLLARQSLGRKSKICSAKTAPSGRSASAEGEPCGSPLTRKPPFRFQNNPLMIKNTPLLTAKNHHPTKNTPNPADFDFYPRKIIIKKWSKLIGGR